ncbi:NmrA-like family domain-containing protein [Lachnellula hyalina]|uniref:NmrA-like family domain-containing protein n=1 Tax=Lachnellula hyalina TaxID=1316788 RepID=A0A8H8TZN0_9HELO|nr:NmrA-like family domain-containing protein [Lachnellula hyalina]TVY26032.1 NmrA-like family domain-containing protein [Lachnellula hyalina]
MSSPQTFFITGASGSQGGAVARKLLASGHKFQALVRDPSKPSSLALQKLGATLIHGDYDDIPALQKAATGCTGVFILPVPTQTPGQELEHTQNIIAAAKAAGIKHAVCSTVTRAEESDRFSFTVPENVPVTKYWESKRGLQAAVQNAGFETWTILQPAWIMKNWIAPVSHFYFAELKGEKVLVTAFAQDTKIDFTAAEDVGSFAVKALTEKDSGLEGKIVPIASEGLTIGESADVMSEVSGVKIGWKLKSEEDIEKEKNVNPKVATQLWQRYDGTRVDIEQVKSYGIPLTSFKQFLENNKEQLLAAVQD